MDGQEKSKNKGELSELYALARLLSDRTIRTDSGRTLSRELTVYKVLRRFGGSLMEFVISGPEVRGISPGNPATMVSRAHLAQLASELLSQIASSGKSSSLSNVGPAVTIMELLNLPSVSSSSRFKSDIGIVIHDPQHNARVTQWYSIKSRLGSPPTLFNSSGATWFKYRLAGSLNGDEILKLNELKPGEMVRELLKRGIGLKYVAMDPRFRENLQLIDGHLEVLLASSLVLSYVDRNRDVPSVMERVVSSNPLGLPVSIAEKAYKLKFTQFLQNVSLGMTPADPWDGMMSVTGGFIEVMKDGSLHFYHPEDQQLLRDHLWSSTKFETPSRARHGFGQIYEIDSESFIDLNLQIRYTN